MEIAEFNKEKGYMIIEGEGGKRNMNKIEELKVAASVNGYPSGAILEKLNEVIRTVNNLKCVEEEQPIYETLSHNDVLIISKSEEGLLVVTNDGNGRVQFERVKWPKEEKEKKE